MRPPQKSQKKNKMSPIGVLNVQIRTRSTIALDFKGQHFLWETLYTEFYMHILVYNSSSFEVVVIQISHEKHKILYLWEINNNVPKLPSV